MTTLRYRERLYRSYLSTHLAALGPADRAAVERDRRLFRAVYRPFLPERKDAAVLEIGCGTGSFIAFLRDEGFTRVQGIDVGEEQVAAARRLGIEGIERADALPFLRSHPAAYDFIAALDVIEHFTKDEVIEFLESVRDALRPGGRLLLRTPNADSPFHSWIRYGDFTHEVTFTPRSIRQVLRATGFGGIEVYPLEPYVHGLPSAVRRLLWLGLKQLIRAYLLVEQGTAGSGVFTANLCAVAQKE